MLNFLRRIRKKSSEIDFRIAHGMKVGKNCHFFSDETIEGSWPWLLSFGDNVTVSTNVTMLAHDASLNMVNCGTKLGRIDVGNNVFIGTGAIVLCNVKIGDNVIVAAGSVVTNDLPSNAVYAGNPARKICSIEELRVKHETLRIERPDFSQMHQWDEWIDASEEDKNKMFDMLDDGCGYV